MSTTDDGIDGYEVLYTTAEGDREWRIGGPSGKLHRTTRDEPAVVRTNGTREWWVNGIQINPLRTKLLSETAKLPVRATSTDAGLDLFSTETVQLQSLERKLISTGVSMAIPVGLYGRIADRSGNAYKLGVHVMAGVIDSGYRGEIKVLLVNLSNTTVTLEAQSKIAQLILTKIEYLTPVSVESLDETDRAEKGFGSSGK